MNVIYGFRCLNMMSKNGRSVLEILEMNERALCSAKIHVTKKYSRKSILKLEEDSSVLTGDVKKGRA